MLAAINPCNYCIHWDPSYPHFHKCAVEEPFYNANIYCPSFCDGLPVQGIQKKGKKFNINKILVNTF